MNIQLQQELAKKEEALAEKEEAFENIQAYVQERREVRSLSISIIEASTMIETTLLILPSLDFSKQHFGEFENHTTCIGLKLLR
jgi:hypothetical protein